MRLPNSTLTAVRGIQVGHATDLRGITGCTVVLCPRATVGAVDQRGGAPGTRETDLLRPSRLVRHVDAVLLAGGSAFGLAASDGVVAWLEKRGVGFRTGAGPVPIVPAAVLYDLEIGSSRARPDAAMGRRACTLASSRIVPQGSVGAGTGCTVGKLRGIARAVKGGIGSAATETTCRRPSERITVAALFAVNAFGDVMGEGGEWLAGLRATPRSVHPASTLMELRNLPAARLSRFESTVIGVVATDARLDREALAHVASMAHDGIARAVHPAHTLVDGDTVFAVATGTRPEVDPSIVGALAAEVTACAIRHAVFFAGSLGGVPASRELRNAAEKLR
jgi:L-aminopeptidase/D-esterase-like protein